LLKQSSSVYGTIVGNVFDSKRCRWNIW
jgi:hypothetical protein